MFLGRTCRLDCTDFQKVTKYYFHRSGEENGAGLAAHSCFGVDYELSLILKEIRVITDQVYVHEIFFNSLLFNIPAIYTIIIPLVPDAQVRRRCGHFARLEIRSHGRGQTVPYYLYPVHNHCHASRATVRTPHHGVVATRPLAATHA